MEFCVFWGTKIAQKSLERNKWRVLKKKESNKRKKKKIIDWNIKKKMLTIL